MRRPVTVVGDVLLDRDLDGFVERVCPDAPVPVVEDVESRARPGGAGLAAVLAAAEGRKVTLVTAIGDDPAGDELRGLLQRASVEVVDLGLRGRTPEKVRVRAHGRPMVRIDHGGRSGTPGPVTEAALGAIAGAAGILVSDYGRGMSAVTRLREAIAERTADAAVVWDPHPRGADPVPRVRLATPNRSEAAGRVSNIEGDDLGATTARARELVERWRAKSVAVTLGARGALLVNGGGSPLVVPAPRVEPGDPCGAGDRFAATATGLLADGALPSEAVTGAVAAAARFVGSGGAGGVSIDVTESSTDSARPAQSVAALVESVRASGGSVVATGGCFDLLHAGHVAVLEAARSLGDCLIVLLNSDASVNRLKGPGRPIVNQDDRAALLMALGCVDAVAVFEEDTPARALRELRPDVFAKGGDYAGTDIPEASIVAEWGGQAVVLPYLEGRSTTRIVKELIGDG